MIATRGGAGLVLVVALLLWARPASAQGSLGGFLAPEFGRVQVRGDYRFTLYPDEDVAGQPTDLGYAQHEVSLSGPLSQDSRHEWSASAGVRLQDFSTDAVLPDGRPFPEELWNVTIGSTYRHRFENGWIAGGQVTVSSPSDEPFHSLDEMAFGTTVFLRLPRGERDAWLFLLNYSSTREFLPHVPFPGLAYLYNPTDRLQLTLGVPLALFYRPFDNVFIDVFYAPITNVRARVGVRLTRTTEVFLAYAWENESYFLADRPDDDERFFAYQQRVTAGVRVGPIYGLRLELAGGYAFDRFYFEGEGYGDRDENRIDVDSGPFATVRLDFRF
jgi:hypothetical protein